MADFEVEPGAAPARSRLSVVILTFRRLDQLAALLPVVARQALAVPGVDAEILVVDNDPGGSAGPVVRAVSDAMAATPKHPVVRYVNETAPGIAAARSRALAETADHDLVHFLDDDLVPAADWLEPLVAAWRATGAAGVLGHVDYRFEAGVDPWVEAGGFFRRRVHPSGTRLSTGATGNLLLDRRQVAALGVDFDPTLGLAGGEDTLFCSQLTRRGGVIVFCGESRVTGLLPADRTTRAGARTRARAHGGTAVRVRLALAQTAAQRARVRGVAVTGGLARIGAGAALEASGVLRRDLARSARGGRLRARGRGIAEAGLGRTVLEYARD